ncbi:uncharacterized protein LOC117334841 [Pecten maximus]|uniref:uncharacterized protein LOC117334841 n=1 Tax=Pecten maximus TaxID=6579 RepID=UPI001458DF88|nr:uncharacterized protein LOC117334841 [Pecten maximus]
MKFPPDIHQIKPASVVLTKLVPTNLPNGITCDIQETPNVDNVVNVAMSESSSSSVKNFSDKANSKSGVSRITDNSQGDSLGKITSPVLRNRSNDRKMTSPKRDLKHETLRTCTTTGKVYIESPRKRRKLLFSTSKFSISSRHDDIDLQVCSDVKEGNMTSNANEQASTSTDKQGCRTKCTLNMLNIPTVVGVNFASSVHASSTVSTEKEKIRGTLFGKIKHTTDTAKQEPRNGGINESVNESTSKELSAKSDDVKPMTNVGNSVYKTKQQTCKSKVYATERYNDSSKKPAISDTDTTGRLNLPKASKKSNIKIESITAKLMREKQEAANYPESTDLNASSYLSKTNRQALITSAYTSVKPKNGQLPLDQRGHRSRKRPVQKQYVRANSAINVPLKEKLPVKERCSSVPSSSASKLKETRKMLKTAISASAVNTKIEYTTLEDWLEGMPKNVPNILVKSKCVSKSKEISKMCKDSSETASAELVRLQKMKGNENPENLTKIKPKRNKKKQGESLIDKSLTPGPSGYRKINGAVIGEGIIKNKSPDKPIITNETEKASPKEKLKSNSVHIKIPNSFSHTTEFQLPNVEGSQMTINRISPPKNKHVSLTYKNELGSNSPISFKFSSQKGMDVQEKKTDEINTATLPNKSVTGAKSLVKMGSFAISKSQEIIPIKSSDLFLTPVTKPNVITPRRLSRAISYADYCAQMDDAEASKDAANSKPRRKSESDIITLSEFRKGDITIDDDTNDPLQNDEKILMKKLNQLHVNNTKCSEETSPQHSLSTDSLDVRDCSEESVKQEKNDKAIKSELDDDNDDDDKDSVHLSDHKYTKTPDASPAKPLTTGILHKTSTKSGTVVIGSRNQNSQVNRKQPVYAVKYGDKLFLIHGKDDKNSGAASTGTNSPKQGRFKAISPKVEIKTETASANNSSPNLTRKNSRKVNANKLISKRKLDFIKKLVLNQKSLKRQKKQSKQPTFYSCRSNRTSVYRNAKVVYITRTNDTIQTTTSRVNITLTKGTDAEIKRWSRYADFKAQLTYENDENTLIHIRVDELQPGFYKLMPESNVSHTTTVSVILTCLPPHPDIIAEGEAFIAVGPLRNIVDTGEGSETHRGMVTMQTRGKS